VSLACEEKDNLAIKASNVSVTRGNHRGIFDHQNNGALRRARSMHHTSWHNEALSRLQFYNLIFQINDEQSFHNIEELVFLVMLVPMILALNDAETNDRVVHLAQCLVEPSVLTSIADCLYIDPFERTIFNVQASHIRIG
jgi:hypothetical protein